ncbi:MAG: hypothetical protein R3F61_33170 [Myxococcota bacterium]
MGPEPTLAAIRGWTVPAAGTSIDAGRALAAHLNGVGLDAEVLQEAREAAGLTLVHVRSSDPPVVALVRHRSDPAIRSYVRVFQSATLEPHQPCLCAAGPVPVDVHAVFDGVLGGAEGSLRGLSFDRGPDFVAEGAGIARAVLGPLSGTDLDPALGLDLLHRLDALALALRPAGMAGSAPDDAVYPMYALVGMGLLAIEAVRTVEPTVEVGWITPDGRWSALETFAEAGGFPSIRIPGRGAMQLTRKLVKRWYAGAGESARELWDAWEAMRPEDGD